MFSNRDSADSPRSSFSYDFAKRAARSGLHQGETLTEPTVFPCCLSCENARFRIRVKCPHCPVCPTVVAALPMLCCSSKPRPDNFRCEETLKEFVAHRVVAPELLSKEVGTHVEPSCKLTAEGGSCSSRAPTRLPWPVRFWSNVHEDDICVVPERSHFFILNFTGEMSQTPGNFM